MATQESTQQPSTDAPPASKPKRGELKGPDYLLEIPKEIRLFVYDYVLAGREWKARYRKPSRHQIVDERGPLAIRFVSTRIADGTFERLFCTLRLDRILLDTGDVSEDAQSLNPVVRGRWDAIRHLHISHAIILSRANSRFVDDNTSGSMRGPIEAAKLRQKLGQIDWSLEGGKVQTVTVIGYEKLLGMDAIPDLLRYLAFFPLLTKLRFVSFPYSTRGINNPTYLPTYTSTSYCTIVGRDVEDEDTGRRKWTMPQIMFEEDQEDPEGQTVLPSELE